MKANSFRAIFIAILSLYFLTGKVLASESDASSETVIVDNKLEEILVSGFRPTQSRELPSSITILDSGIIDDLSVQHFEELTHFVPNLNWAGGASRPRYFQIRGIGERSQYEGAPNPSVGFLIDDLDFSALGGVATMFDVEQIEVLSGPQGTRYGANALAGLIYVQYKQPTDYFDAKVTATLGNDDTHTLGTAFGGPIYDSLNYRAVVHKNKSNGFRRNAFLSRDDTNGRDETSLRLKLAYTTGTDWKFDFSAMHVDVNNGYDAFAVDNSFTTQSDRPGQDAQQSTGLVLKTDGQLSSAIGFTSITGASQSDVVFSFDADWGNNDFWSPVIYDYFSQTDRERKNLSQEFRLASSPESGLLNGKFEWVAGAIFTQNEETNLTRDDGNFEGFTSLDSISRDYSASTVAAFGDIDYALADRVTLNMGLRFEKRKADYIDSNGEQFNPGESNVGGQVALNYEYDSATSLYAKIARGYKAGGFNLGLPSEAENDTLLFDAEYLWNYELGLKGNYLDERLSLNANAFYMQRADQQVQASRQLDPNNPATFVFFTDNAGEGENKGIELDVSIDLNDALSLYSSLGLLYTEIKNFAGNSNGREQAHAPNYTYAVGGRFDFLNNWFARMDVSGKDEFYFSDSHNQISQPYTIVNARLGYETKNWSLTAWGRNVFNENYSVRGFFFGNEPAKDFADTLYVRKGDPKHIGLTFEYFYD